MCADWTYSKSCRIVIENIEARISFEKQQNPRTYSNILNESYTSKNPSNRMHARGLLPSNRMHARALLPSNRMHARGLLPSNRVVII
jgi:hypothetical protein